MNMNHRNIVLLLLVLVMPVFLLLVSCGDEGAGGIADTTSKVTDAS